MDRTDLCKIENIELLNKKNYLINKAIDYIEDLRQSLKHECKLQTSGIIISLYKVGVIRYCNVSDMIKHLNNVFEEIGDDVNKSKEKFIKYLTYDSNEKNEEDNLKKASEIFNQIKNKNIEYLSEPLKSVVNLAINGELENWFNHDNLYFMLECEENCNTCSGIFKTIPAMIFNNNEIKLYEVYEEVIYILDNMIAEFERYVNQAFNDDIF